METTAVSWHTDISVPQLKRPSCIFFEEEGTSSSTIRDIDEKIKVVNEGYKRYVRIFI